MRAIALWALATTACERAPAALPAPTPTPTERAVEPTPKPVEKPPVEVPKPVEKAPEPVADPAPQVSPVRPPAQVRRRRAMPIPNEEDLPTPPDLEPRAYTKWLRDQPADTQAQIARFCRAHKLDFREVCGGIGPYRIPMPPSRVRMPGESEPTETRDQWFASLNATQRAFVSRYCDNGNEDFAFTDLCGATPLVVSWDGATVPLTDAPGRFAFRAGDPVATTWPTAATPWLALDRDGDGAITHGGELFGPTASNGFEALAPLDANGDGRLDARDPAFASLLLWTDRDLDRASSPAELTSAAATLVSIDLAYASVPRCMSLGCERERAAMTWRDAAGTLHAGAVIDIYVKYR